MMYRSGSSLDLSFFPLFLNFVRPRILQMIVRHILLLDYADRLNGRSITN